MEGFSDAATGKRLEQDLRRNGNEYARVYVYENVGHAFMNDSPAPFASFAEREEKMGESFPPYSPSRAKLAWGRLFKFFDQHLVVRDAADEL